jgi:hypothetical protein
MMNLTSVKRVDKNGVLTTKHVRADSPKKAPTAPVPAPTIKSKKAPAKQTASTDRKRWRVNINNWGDCDQDLRFICAEYHPAEQTYECSDAEAYEVTTVINPANALPLLAIGIRTADAARRFLDEAGASYLKAENSLAEQVIDRGIQATEFINFASKHPDYSNHNTFIDAAECWTHPVVKQVDSQRASQTAAEFKPLISMILDGEIAWNDIREIGVRAVAERSMGTNRFVEHLVRLKNGTSGFQSAAEIAEVLSDTSSSSSNGLDLADCYGLEGYRNLPTKNNWTASRLINALRERDHSKAERFEIFEYAMRVGLNPEPKDIISLYEAGVSSEDARLGLVSKLTTNQIIGLNNSEVASSVSSGYL